MVSLTADSSSFPCINIHLTPPTKQSLSLSLSVSLSKYFNQKNLSLLKPQALTHNDSQQHSGNTSLSMFPFLCLVVKKVDNLEWKWKWGFGFYCSCCFGTKSIGDQDWKKLMGHSFFWVSQMFESERFNILINFLCFSQFNFWQKKPRKWKVNIKSKIRMFHFIFSFHLFSYQTRQFDFLYECDCV